MIPAEKWLGVLRALGVKPATAATWAQILSEEIKANTFSKGPREVVDFLPEIVHESAKLERLEENLNYTPQGLLSTFGLHRITGEQALRMGRIDNKQVADQQEIANTVYGGEWGRQHLGNILPGDGWTYRGRGPIQITGRDNYRRVGDLMGQNLVGIPDLLSQPRFALEAAIAWWEDRIPDSMLGETTSIRKRVNGGALGLDEVRAYTRIVREAFQKLGIDHG